MPGDSPASAQPGSGSGRLIILSAAIMIGLCLLITLIATSGLFLLADLAPDNTATPTASPTIISSTRVAVVPSSTPENSPAGVLASPFAATRQPSATAAPQISPTPAPTASETPDPAAVECPPPEGWQTHQVQPGETLFAYVLGAMSTGVEITTLDVRRANCLTDNLLQVGQTLYLPPGAAENAPSSEPVGAPPALAAAGPRAPNCDPHCTISIRPGSRAEQIAAAVDNVPVGFWGADFMAAVTSGAGLPAYGFLASKPPGASLEGFLFPGTYELSNATTAQDFRNMLLERFAANYSPDFEAAAQAHGLSFYQAITLASIIQRESWAYSEQVLISSVFHNRLRIGEKLGATVTMQYALGTPANWWPRVTGGQINTASPYNTNLNPGLPPTPIDSPGLDAIRAALNPADTDYLYFTGNCQGSGNLYASTFDQHLANVNLCN